MKTVACDLDGVVYVGDEGVPGAGDALDALRASGRTIVFVTNNSTQTPQTVANSVYHLTGFAVDPGDVVTSATVTAMALRGHARRVMIVGHDNLAATFDAHGFEVTGDRHMTEAVVVGLDFGLTYGTLAEAALAIGAGALFYATNTDASLPTAEGPIPGGGAIVAALATATGKQPVVCGKPHEPTAKALRSLVGEGRVLVVGDRPETDIALGKSQGWPTALVLSGVTSSATGLADELRPDLVLGSLAELPGALGN